MAKVGLEDQDPFSCPICLDPLENPVTIPCGHNYCMACIRDYWNERETYSCPECREIFSPRPVLNKNTMFAEVVERFRKAKLRDSSPAQSGPRKCSMCTGQKVQPAKFCPQGRESYCEAHAAPHNTGLREKHTVIVVSGEPSKNVCLHRNMPLEIYCRTDQQLICSLCFVEHHRDHDTVSVRPRYEEQVDKNSHGKRQHRHTSHEHGSRKHQQGRHGRTHRRSLHSKSGHRASHHKGHGNTLGRHGHQEASGHTTGMEGRGRHGGLHRSSRHGRSGH